MKILNGLKQAERYVKYLNKTQSWSNSEGCGCCYSHGNYRIDGKKIIYSVTGETIGRFFVSAQVIGIIKLFKS